METIEIVRCFVARNPGEEGSVRYIPLEIFEMWRFLMERVHNLTVIEPMISVWVPEGNGNFNDVDEDAENVIEVTFKYRKNGDFARPVTRYLPEENFDQVYGFFMQHFPDESKMEGVQRRNGKFFSKKGVPYHG